VAVIQIMVAFVVIKPCIQGLCWSFRGMYCPYLQGVWIMCQLCRKAGETFWPIRAMKLPLALYKSSSVLWLKFPATFPYNW